VPKRRCTLSRAAKLSGAPGREFLGFGYTFLYITLRQQDYALLLGSIALFLVLGVVMFVTRRVDWYARDAS